MSEPEIYCERRGVAGVVRLNRPKALNALTLDMVRVLRPALDAWERDPAVKCVVVTAAGERAFCAGGDIRHLYDLGRAGRCDEALQFWREEYPLNVRIKRYPKPYVALIDGIVMGGGVGVSLHGSHRVAGERYTFAMPEVGIGFFPDVGATYALPRLPGKVGTYLALTGARVGQGDALALGLATHAAKSGAFADIAEALMAGEPVDAGARRPRDNPEGGLARKQAPCDRRAAFQATASPTSSRRSKPPWSKVRPSRPKPPPRWRRNRPQASPSRSSRCAAGGALSFEEAMRVEFRIVSRIVRRPRLLRGCARGDRRQGPSAGLAAVGHRAM